MDLKSEYADITETSWSSFPASLRGKKNVSSFFALRSQVRHYCIKNLSTFVNISQLGPKGDFILQQKKKTKNEKNTHNLSISTPWSHSSHSSLMNPISVETRWVVSPCHLAPALCRAIWKRPMMDKKWSTWVQVKNDIWSHLGFIICRGWNDDFFWAHGWSLVDIPIFSSTRIAQYDYTTDRPSHGLVLLLINTVPKQHYSNSDVDWEPSWTSQKWQSHWEASGNRIEEEILKGNWLKKGKQALLSIIRS